MITETATDVVQCETSAEYTQVCRYLAANPVLGATAEYDPVGLKVTFTSTQTYTEFPDVP